MDVNLKKRIQVLIARTSNLGICSCRVNLSTNLVNYSITGDKYNRLVDSIKLEYPITKEIPVFETGIDIVNFLSD